MPAWDGLVPERWLRTRDGLAVTACDLPGRGLVTGILLLPAGLEREPAGHAGIARVAAGCLEATGRGGSGSLDGAVADAGGRVRVTVHWDSIRVTFRCMASSLPGVTAAVVGAARNPDFRPETVERERRRCLESLRYRCRIPFPRALNALWQVVHAPGTPYARPEWGLADDIAHVGPEEVARFWPGSARLAVAGDLGDWLSTLEPAGEPVPADLCDGRWAARVWPEPVLLDDPGAKRVHVMAGHVGPARRHGDFAAATVLGTILGGMEDCRLDRRLREGVGVSYEPMAEFERVRPHVLWAWVETAEEHAVRALETVAREIRALHEGRLETFEVVNAVRRCLRARSFPDTAEDFALLMVEECLYGGSLAEELDAISKLGTGDVAEAGSRLLAPDHLGIVVLGDAERLAGPLRSVLSRPIDVWGWGDARVGGASGA